jgi:hypothetical protein
LWLLRRREITPAAKLIFARLAFFDGQGEGAYPSKLGLARECGLSARNVFDSLRQLEAFGLIERAGFSRWRTTVYRVVLGHPWSLDPTANSAVDTPDNLKTVGLSHGLSDQGQQNLQSLDDQGQQNLHFANGETPNPRRFLHTKMCSGGKSSPGVSADHAAVRSSVSSLLPPDAEIRRWQADARSFNSKPFSSSPLVPAEPNQQLHQ